jgi:hypothetical protein
MDWGFYKNTNMFKSLLIVIIFFAFGCGADKYQTSHYYTVAEQDTLLTNIITYVYQKAPGATDSTKWEPQFRTFYKNSLPSFFIQNYFIDSQGWHYYFLIRPVGGSDKRRGVIGKFKLTKGSLKPTEFEEIACTPHLDEEIVQERGRFLFETLVKNGTIEKKFLTMRQYVEWPDSSLVYNKKTNNWENPQ